MWLVALALPLGMAFHAPIVCLAQEKTDEELKAEQTKAAETKAADEKAAAIQKRAEQAARIRAERAALAQEKKGQQGDLVGPPGPNAAQTDPKSARPGATVPAPTVVLKPGEVPGIRFDTPIYDFGLVRAGADIVHDFWFTNTGTGPLEILSVKPS